MEAMRFLNDVSLPGNGSVRGAFWNRNRKTLAVTSSFRLLTEPRARAAYGGQRLRHRLALYHPPGTPLVGVFDESAFPINDVAFHPSKPIVAIAAGSYDGGFCFEGQLFLWDWQTGRSLSVADRIPEVVRVRFADDGTTLDAAVRPWDEGSVAGKGDPFQLLFDLTLKLGDWRAGFERQEIAAQIERQTPRPASDLTADGRFAAYADPERVIASAFGLSSLRSRSPIWDVAFTGTGAVASVHDDCLLEIWARDDARIQVFEGEGHGVQIFPRPSPLVHVSRFGSNAAGAFKAVKTDLLAFTDNELLPVSSLEGAYSFSASQDGLVLGRLDRSFEPGHPKEDAIIDPRLGSVVRCDLGHYDVFNHYLRIDGAPYLFLVQGTPPTSHERKHLCMVSPEGNVRRLWPILGDDGRQASHAMECCFGYVDDGQGEGIVAAGKHYHSSAAKPYSGFIYRRNLSDGRELWRHPTTASVTNIKCPPGGAVVFAAFLDGGFAAFKSDTGKVLAWKLLKTDGFANVAFSFDVSATHAVLGFLDGRYGICALSELLQT